MEVRKYTDKLLSMANDGILSYELIARECLSYMSEHEVEDMYRVFEANGFGCKVTYGPKIKKGKVGMGYTTDFFGNFNLDRELLPEHSEYLSAFAYTRRMKRNSEIAEKFTDVVREKVGLGIGEEGGYYVGEKENFGQKRDESVIDGNNPPEGQPGLWCQWVPTEDNKGICWDEGEKFYHYVEWLEYIIVHFLKPWGYVLNGEVRWQGEDEYDKGIITVKDNVVYSLGD